MPVVDTVGRLVTILGTDEEIGKHLAAANAEAVFDNRGRLRAIKLLPGGDDRGHSGERHGSSLKTTSRSKNDWGIWIGPLSEHGHSLAASHKQLPPPQIPRVACVDPTDIPPDEPMFPPKAVSPSPSKRTVSAVDRLGLSIDSDTRRRSRFYRNFGVEVAPESQGVYRPFAAGPQSSQARTLILKSIDKALAVTSRSADDA